MTAIVRLLTVSLYIVHISVNNYGPNHHKAKFVLSDGDRYATGTLDITASKRKLRSPRQIKAENVNMENCTHYFHSLEYWKSTVLHPAILTALNMNLKIILDFKC